MTLHSLSSPSLKSNLLKNRPSPDRHILSHFHFPPTSEDAGIANLADLNISYTLHAPHRNIDVSVTRLHQFLTGKECDAILNQVEEKSEARWLIANQNLAITRPQRPNPSFRINTRQLITTTSDILSSDILNRINSIMGASSNNEITCGNVIRYTAGGYIIPHYDPGYQTLLIYLNSIEKLDGGATCFSNLPRSNEFLDQVCSAQPLHTCYQPIQGDAIWWGNSFTSDLHGLTTRFSPLISPGAYHSHEMIHYSTPLRFGSPPKYIIQCATL